MLSLIKDYATFCATIAERKMHCYTRKKEALKGCNFKRNIGLKVNEVIESVLIFSESL